MALSPFLGRDGVFHRFAYVKLHIARIYRSGRTTETTRALGRRAKAARGLGVREC